MTALYAHTPNDKGKWHSLYQHLTDVTELAQGLCRQIQSGRSSVQDRIIA